MVEPANSDPALASTPDFERLSGPGRGGVVIDTHPTERFANVGGAEDLLAVLREVVDDIKAFQGGDKRVELPSSLFLYGSGSGKGLITRALAGEAGVPIVAVSASELLGSPAPAAQLEHVLSQAAEAGRSPNQGEQQVFIVHISDMEHFFEVDQHGYPVPPSGTDRQVLHRIFSELHGSTDSNRIVVGSGYIDSHATAEFVRANGFGRVYEVYIPESVQARLEAVQKLFEAKYEPKGFNLGSPDDLEFFGRLTAGLSVGGIDQILKVSFGSARRRGEDTVKLEDLVHGYQSVEFGYPRNLFTSEQAALSRDAHEIGHALIAHSAGIPILLVSNTSWGRVGGAVLPDRSMLEGTLRSKKQALTDLLIGFGGIAAEKVVLGDLEVTEGAAHDLQKVQLIARRIVATGMFGDSYEPLGFDGEGLSVREAHLNQLTALLKTARSTSERIIKKIGRGVVSGIALDIRERGGEIFWPDADTVLKERLGESTQRAIGQIIERYFQDPLGGGSTGGTTGAIEG